MQHQLMITMLFCRRYQFRARQKHQFVPENHPGAREYFFLQEHRPGNPDNSALCSPGGARTPQRTLLLQLHCEKSLRQGQG